MSEAYRQAGVDLELGDELSGMLFEAAKQTWVNRIGKYGYPTADNDSFFAGRSLSIKHLLEVTNPEGLRKYMGDDGVGTKVEVAEREKNNRTMAFDLLAMVVDDASIKGFEPAVVTTTLDVRKLKPEFRPEMKELALGYIAAAMAGGVAIVNGEVAELGHLVGGYQERMTVRECLDATYHIWRYRKFPELNKTFQFSWNATLEAVGHEKRIVTGENVRPGDALVGFREMGFRSNGLSLVRRIAEKQYGHEWHNKTLDGRRLGELVLTPSIIYSPVMVEAFGGYDLRNGAKAPFTAAAHITGGGIPGKLGRALKASGYGAEISNPFDQPLAMLHLAKVGRVNDDEALRVWNGGHGMIAATRNPQELIGLADSKGIEAKIIGEVTKDQHIIIRSNGNQPGKKLVYEAHK